MSDRTKSLINAWLPALVALAGFIGNAMWFAKWTGEMETRMAANESIVREHTSELKSDRYVPRTEYTAAARSRDTEISDIKQGVREINGKLDALLTRTSPLTLSSQKNE